MDTSTDMSNNCRTRWCGLTTKSICARGKKCISHLEKAQGRVLVFVGGGCRRVITRRESWQMSQVREPLPPGPEGPERAPTESSSLISLPREKTDQENTAAGDKDIKQPSSNQSTQPEIQDQSVWGNRTDGDLIRTQPQRLPQPNTSALERGEEESGKIQNGHAGLSNGSGIHNGVKHVPADNRKLSAPVSEKMHRKIQSTLSVNSNSSKKSKISSVFSQKPGTSPEDCCVHCILACLFCEFLTLCNIVLGQASCGICTSEACCCCCGDEMGDDCNCPCDMDCGIMDACCESSDCLEICMECCGICFPS
ncbi:myoD family inhibitor domain-containing protein isoform 2-T2 [Alca torda]